MKKFKAAQLAYDVMRAKEMNKVTGGFSGYCTYCGRKVPGGGDDCRMCRPMCYYCGESFNPGSTHYCSGMVVED